MKRSLEKRLRSVNRYWRLKWYRDTLIRKCCMAWWRTYYTIRDAIKPRPEGYYDFTE